MIPAALIAALARAQRIVVLTGAGVSAESGLSTFRDKQVGLWEHFDPMQLATREAFELDPELVWGWYEWRRMQVLRAKPNAGHLAIKALSDHVPGATLITQNVDDLHERAGSDPVHHLHGRIAQPYCISCGSPHVLPPAIPDEPPGGRRLPPPRCLQCAGMVRPGVVWFGETLPGQEWQLAARAARECDMFFCIGTSSIVYPAGAADAQLTLDLRGSSGVVLPQLVEQTWQ